MSRERPETRIDVAFFRCSRFRADILIHVLIHGDYTCTKEVFYMDGRCVQTHTIPALLPVPPGFLGRSVWLRGVYRCILDQLLSSLTNFSRSSGDTGSRQRSLHRSMSFTGSTTTCAEKKNTHTYVHTVSTLE